MTGTAVSADVVSQTPIGATETCFRCQAKMFAVMQDSDRQREIDQAGSIIYVQAGTRGKAARRSFLPFYMMKGGNMMSARLEHRTVARADHPDTLCLIRLPSNSSHLQLSGSSDRDFPKAQAHACILLYVFSVLVTFNL